MNEEIKLEYMHLCDYALQGKDNKVSLIGIFDFFLRTKAPSFFIATKISVNKKSKYEFLFEIKSKDDKETIFKAPEPIVVPEDASALSYNLLVSLNKIDFKNSGDYKVLVHVDGKYSIEGISFEVK